MKKTVLVAFLTFITMNLCAQGSFIRTGNTSGNKFYIASLPKNNSSNYHKLKIDLYGGTWYDWTMGYRTYSISSRSDNTSNPIMITQEQRGGSTGNYALKVYETTTGYDFVIETVGSYAAIFVQAYLSYAGSDGVTQNTVQEIKPYSAGSNIDITSKARFMNIYYTDNNGNIGIGTVPKAKLDVNGKIKSSGLDVAGTINAREVNITVSAGADHVFYPGYALMPLSEVESFVKENKHLPDIPSEKQMVEEGLNVNEMQIKLLQKIEELTLYVIEQDKQNKDLQKQVNELKVQLNDKQP